MNQSTQIDGKLQRHRAAYLIATGVYAGHLKFAPGTAGALEGVAVYAGSGALARALALTPGEQFLLFLLLNVLVFAGGVWAADRVCLNLGLEDPQQIVIDEISGQMIALIPLSLAPSIAGVLAAFGLFRLFDILKPYPISKLERLPGGFGVMLDDALAGIYASVLVWVGHLLHAI